jgi:hypothetical protein
MTNKQAKVDVLVLGCPHFEGSVNDVIPSGKINLDTEKRMSEMNFLRKKIIRFNPDMIAAEVHYKKQNIINRQFSGFVNGRFAITQNEIYQIGFVLAKELKLSAPACIDCDRNFPYNKVRRFALKNKKKENLSYLEKLLKDKERESRLLLKEQTLLSYMKWLNTDINIAAAHYPYNPGLLTLGRKGQQPGPELTGYWYYDNIQIFARLLQTINTNTKRVLLIIGTGHLFILKQLIEDNECLK